ncbi:MBL fold metallo-hydrolase [Halobacterium sp. KA-4]|jgi:phosphoribosyl 1,2-cyclic phosphate phosphodiesterase|uniref:MBL fold metallo-hydrolase n=1 Tax=Halobacterium sp. KA-4 TaxID=2896367 RepID=UPI001E617121|nr:MBL fold metallo-hydrolase [Halobacterium sp. KA-4]MCD2198814.1 MBL fold metallo-hydrolase [Halobacterium sp. KA-4]
MRVTLLGTGDTTGTPTPGCDCETCQAARDRGVERTRFAVHVEDEASGDALLLDFSPDFRTQFLREDVPLPDAGVVSHIHFDHLDGLGNSYRLFDELPVYAADETDPKTDESVAETVARKYDYLDNVDPRAVTPHETFEAAGFDVTLVPVDHPPLLCYGVVVERDGAKLSLSGDTTYDIPDESLAAMRVPDLLLSDGIVPAHLADHHPVGGRHEDADGVPRTFGTKHMTKEGALALGDELDAEETRVVHVSHFYPADEAFDDALAVDGETFDL